MLTKTQAQQAYQEITTKYQQAIEEARTADGWDLSLVYSIEGSPEEKQTRINEWDQQLEQLDTQLAHIAEMGKKAEDLQRRNLGANLETPAAPAGLLTLNQFVADYAKSPQLASKDLGSWHAPLSLKARFSGGSWNQPDEFSGLVVPEASKPITIIDVMPQAPTTQDSVIWLEQTTRTNAATARAAGGALPESSIEYTQQVTQVRSIGHYVPVTDEILADHAQVQLILMNDMRFGVLQALDEIIINGNGTAPNPRGIANLTGTNTQPKGTDTILDAVRKAKTLCMTTGKAQPNAVLMHPNDFQEVETFTACLLYTSPSPRD